MIRNLLRRSERPATLEIRNLKFKILLLAPATLRRYFYIFIIVGVILVNFTPSPVFAVRPDSAKDTLADSRPSVTSNNTFIVDQAGTGSGTDFAAGDTIIFDWPAGFTFPADGTWVTGDFTFHEGITRTVIAVGAAPTCTPGGNNVSVTTDQTNLKLTVTACATYNASAGGNNITFTVGGTNKITNATAGVYQINIAGTYGDDAQDVVVVMTAAITLSATIDEVLTLTVAAVSFINCSTTGGTTRTSTSTTIPWGTISTEAFYDVCQWLTVATNAGGGYTVTVYTVAGLDSGANAFAVGSGDGSATLTTPNTWATATNNGYAVCMEDQSGDPAATANAGWDTADEQCGGATQKFELVADLSGSQTPSTIMSSATGTSEDLALVGWRISADAAQAAGTYTGTADYITTGTF